jgi:hypothetical protein
LSVHASLAVILVVPLPSAAEGSTNVTTGSGQRALVVIPALQMASQYEGTRLSRRKSEVSE